MLTYMRFCKYSCVAEEKKKFEGGKKVDGKNVSGIQSYVLLVRGFC